MKHLFYNVIYVKEHWSYDCKKKNEIIAFDSWNLDMLTKLTILAKKLGIWENLP